MTAPSTGTATPGSPGRGSSTPGTAAPGAVPPSAPPPAAPLGAAPSSDEVRRAADLTRMKRTATGLLVAATVVFLVTRALEGDSSWLGYVRATAEAAMVGAIADWFAVTALFRHPLGLPIPHTAIIPTRKDDIGRGLGTFVQQNFLTREVVTERLAGFSLASRLGAWLADPVHAARVGDQAGGVLRSTLATLRDDDVQEALETAVARRVRAIEAGPLLSRGIELAVADGRHQELLSVLLAKVAEAVEENGELVRTRLQRETPWWVPDRFDDRIFARVHGGMQGFLREVAADPAHEMRATLDQRLAKLADELARTPSMMARANELKEEVLDHPALRDWSATVWADLKRSLLAHADDPESDLRRRLVDAVRRFGEHLRDDPALQHRVDSWLTSMAVEAVERSRGEVGEVIATTVARWDPSEATRRIELQVGRDLQFIRINGTVVGGLAGLVIHSVGRLIG